MKKRTICSISSISVVVKRTMEEREPLLQSGIYIVELPDKK